MAGQRKPRPTRGSAPYSPISNPPRYVSDATGRAVEVVLSYADYRELLRLLARHADWETLPPQPPAAGRAPVLARALAGTRRRRYRGRPYLRVRTGRPPPPGTPATGF